MLRAEVCGVIGGPIQKTSWLFAGELRKSGAHKRRLTERCSPRVEQHIDDNWRTQDREQFRLRFVWRHLFHAQRSANRATDCLDLLGLRERLRSGHDVFATSVAGLTQRANGD